MSRRSAREYALQVLYSRELNPETEAIDSSALKLSDKDKAFADALVKSVAEHEEINELIGSHLKNWSLSQLNVVDKSILKLAVAEYFYMQDLRSDRNVIINEAVEMGKLYGGDSSYRFINGVLNQVMKGK
ncbi:transcription antitermination factor NusB [Dialister sp.]|jgi:N utilization substance protein B|uniref:transcription antitermination factor NusB n=1 Tax=Dialister sp. TaxID=1955814 RepID=UPI002E81CD9E|nr:transcription antitermination factor NusB [Dialister sp.]MEE3452059.1 transcription antitermination factor NusB [Dialister sp.]